MIAAAAAKSSLAIGNAAVMGTELTLHPSVIQLLIILALNHLLQRKQILHLEHYCLVNVEFCVLPAVPSDTSLVLGTVTQKLFLGPVHLVGHLWQECPATVSSADINAVPMQLELVNALYAPHGGEYGDLNVNVIKFHTLDRYEAWVLKGCSAGHLGHYIMKGIILTEGAYAAT